MLIFDGFEGFTLNGDFNLMRDKHTLAGSANKVKPARAGKATYEGALSGGLYTECPSDGNR